MFVATFHGAVKGVADFPDEIQEFAERFSGLAGVTWTPAGEMIRIEDSSHTGWKLYRMGV